MELSLERKVFTEISTIGELSIDGVLFCDTLEDRVRAPGVKVPKATAIPEGVYQVVIDWSPNHNRDLPHVLDVPMFTGIRIHVGNTDVDTEGCILIGLRSGPDVIMDSKKAFDLFYPRLQAALDAGQNVRITVFQSPEVLVPAELLMV